MIDGRGGSSFINRAHPSASPGRDRRLEGGPERGSPEKMPPDVMRDGGPGVSWPTH